MNLAFIFWATLSTQKSTVLYRNENTFPVYITSGAASKTLGSHEIQTKPSGIREHAARLQRHKAQRQNATAKALVVVSDSQSNLVLSDVDNSAAPSPPTENASVRWNDRAIHSAIKNTLTSPPEVQPPQQFNDRWPLTNKEKFAAAMEDAAIPNCMDPEALKHHPAKLGGVQLKGLLALPAWIHAAATGKCK